MCKKVRQFYFGNESVNNTTTLKNYFEIMSDVAFNYAIDRSVNAYADSSTGQTYYYRYIWSFWIAIYY